MSKEITIELRNLAIGYPHRVVAEGLSATVYSGELTCLIGSNGVGKSTLLRTIAAFQPKLGGSILVRGGEIDGYKSRELARLISVVLTERIEVGHMTVLTLSPSGAASTPAFGERWMPPMSGKPSTPSVSWVWRALLPETSGRSATESDRR